jgi:toxin ParE1/3/4
MPPDFRITPRARDDLKNIGRYTLKIWGKKQRDIYLRRLDKRFQWLVKNPKAGKHRPDIHEAYHCFPQGPHLVFYTLREGGIDIIGIPHQDMDILNYFSP